MNELYKVAADLIPKPNAWGKLTVSNLNTYSFLYDFIDTTGEDSDPVQLYTKLVALHRSSKSPNDIFRFHINPLRGKLPLQMI